MVTSRATAGDDSRPRARYWPVLAILAMALAGCGVLLWWLANAETREIQGLPDRQRIPLYRRTMENLANVCDPAAPRSLRDFCHNEAQLVLRFRECDRDPHCGELARRHLPQPRR